MISDPASVLSIEAWLAEARTQLEQGSDSARLDAELLLAQGLADIARVAGARPR